MYDTYQKNKRFNGNELDATLSLFYVGPPLGDDPLEAIIKTRDDGSTYCNLSLWGDLQSALEQTQQGDKLYQVDVDLLRSLSLDNTPISTRVLSDFLGWDPLYTSHYIDEESEKVERIDVLGQPFIAGSDVALIDENAHNESDWALLGKSHRIAPALADETDALAALFAAQGVGYLPRNRYWVRAGERARRMTLFDPGAVVSIVPRSFASLINDDYLLRLLTTLPYLPSVEAASLHYKKWLTEINRQSDKKTVIRIGDMAVAYLNNKGSIEFCLISELNHPINPALIWDDENHNWLDLGNTRKPLFDFSDHAVHFIPAFALEL